MHVLKVHSGKIQTNESFMKNSWEKKKTKSKKNIYFFFYKSRNLGKTLRYRIKCKGSQIRGFFCKRLFLPLARDYT